MTPRKWSLADALGALLPLRGADPEKWSAHARETALAEHHAGGRPQRRWPCREPLLKVSSNLGKICKIRTMQPRLGPYRQRWVPDDMYLVADGMSRVCSSKQRTIRRRGRPGLRAWRRAQNSAQAQVSPAAAHSTSLQPEIASARAFTCRLRSPATSGSVARRKNRQPSRPNPPQLSSK